MVKVVIHNSWLAAKEQSLIEVPKCHSKTISLPYASVNSVASGITRLNKLGGLHNLGLLVIDPYIHNYGLNFLFLMAGHSGKAYAMLAHAVCTPLQKAWLI